MSNSMLSDPNKKEVSTAVSSSDELSFGSLTGGIGLDVRDNLIVERWKLLRRHMRTLLTLGVIGAILGLAASSLQKPAYQASALLEIQGTNEDFLNLKNVTPISQDSAAVSIDEIQTYIRRLQSKSLLAPVVEKLQLLGKPEKPGLLHSLRRLFGGANTSTDALEASIDRAATNLQIREIGRSRMVEITFSSDNPAGAAAFPNALALELLEQNLHSRGTLSQSVSQWINHQLDDTRADLVKSEKALENYTRHAGLLYLNGSSNANGLNSTGESLSGEKLRQVQEELSRAEADRIGKESQYTLARDSPPETLPFLTDDAAVHVQQDKLIDLRRQKAELGTNYTPRYVTMKSLDAQINVLQDALAQERLTILRQIENDYLAASGREKLLRRQYTEQSKLVDDEGVKAVEYQMLKRDVESNRQLYDDMLQRTKQASVAAALRANNIRITDAARPPVAPYKPNPPVNVAIGLISGVFFGGIWVSLFAGQGKITQPGELNSIAGVAELGAIRSSAPPLKERDAWELGALRMSDEDRLLESLSLVTRNRQPSATAQSYGSILTSLRLSDRFRECHVITLTSPGAVEGKTTVLSGLGVVLARMQQRVLVVDGDLYKPELHKKLDGHNEIGLADLLRLPDVSRMNLSEFIQETGIPNLSLLAGGSGGPAPLLFSRRLKDMFRELRESYDFVLLDTPPMLQIPDARVFGKLSDFVILVIRAGKTSREAALWSLDRLREDGVPVLGTVLNDWDASSAASKYYPRYGRGVTDPRQGYDSSQSRV